MKKIMSAILMLAMLLSLGGCFFPRPWHDSGGGYDRGGDRGHDKGGHSRHFEGGQDHDRDGDRYERR